MLPNMIGYALVTMAIDHTPQVDLWGSTPELVCSRQQHSTLEPCSPPFAIGTSIPVLKFSCQY